MLAYVNYVFLTVVPIISKRGTLANRFNSFISFGSGFPNQPLLAIHFCLRNDIALLAKGLFVIVLLDIGSPPIKKLVIPVTSQKIVINLLIPFLYNFL